MKEKLSVLAILVCCISLLAGCNNHQKKVNQTVEVPQVFRNFISTKYPQATILKLDKEKSGTEIDIKDKGIHKEVSFNEKNEWISTQWDTRLEDVPVVVTDELASSAYNQYKVLEVDAIEKPAGMFYVFELKQDNNKVQLTFDSEGQLIE